MKIKIEHNPPLEKLNALGVQKWPIWECEPSSFPWHYDTDETCYFLEGEVVVTPAEGDPVQIHAGDLVRFPAGLSCTWHVKQKVRKHYHFS